MTTLLVTVHIIVCLFLIVIVLLQHGKGADMGATFGGSSQTIFGTEGPLPLLNKVTTFAAILFMVTSLVLAYRSAHLTRGSVMQAVEAPLRAPIENILEKAPETIPLPGTEESAAPERFPAGE
ncbi:MAG: preprotein translocase subunit SecG [Desulfobulbaceae bacterium]|nr:preprotein translocase subunit SecG [Desulfobulbaceae bacterium]